jgi:hypothetical protein
MEEIDRDETGTIGRLGNRGRNEALGPYLTGNI